MLECRENLGLPFSNNHLPAVFTLTFGAEATIWCHHVGNNFATLMGRLLVHMLPSRVET